MWLRDCGFDCALAENGQQAWDLICECHTDLLLTDLEMPEMCGLELLQKVRHAADERICKLPVLVMTSLRDGQTLNVVLQMNGDGLFQKPLDRQATLSAILDLVAGRTSLRHIAQSGNTCVQGNGLISPTFRRLLKTVAKNES